MQTGWNLKLLYQSPKDPKIEKDLAAIVHGCVQFEKKYRNRKEHLKNDRALFWALVGYERLSELTDSSRPLIYYYLRKYLNSSDQEAQAKINKYTDILTKAENRILFFTLALGKIQPEKQKQFLKSKRLSHHRYFLQKIFENSKYQLSESEEKILNLKTMPSHTLWKQGVEKVVDKLQIPFKGKKMTVSEAVSILRQLSVFDRRDLWKKVREALFTASDFAESEMNALVLNKKINDELRGFTEPYSATILGYENKEQTVVNLVRVVTDHFSISQRFYSLKARLLGMKKLEYADRSAEIELDRKRRVQFSFPETVEIVKKSFNRIDPKFARIVQEFADRGQVDVFPKKGKTGGAFQLSSLNNPSFVLLNHVGNYDSVRTFGHEMGHAMHSTLSKSQSPLYQHYTIATAEVASTFFESFVFEELLERMSEKEKIVALHDRIQDEINTIFRQIALFNFEVDLHRTIRERGNMSKDEIATLLNTHIAKCHGPIIRYEPMDGYYFIYWSHIRRFFYVYSYAFGQLISRALAERVKQNGEKAVREVETFLRAGGSASPEDIFKRIGIDVTKASFWKEGLASIDRDIDRLERLAKKAEMI